MKKKLIQLLGDDYEALFEVPYDTTEEHIRIFYTTFQKHDENKLLDDSNFENYMAEFFPEAGFDRVFVDEIYV